MNVQRLGQQVVVENRRAMRGIVGYEMVARAGRRGYTLVMRQGTVDCAGAVSNVTPGGSGTSSRSRVLTTPTSWL